MTASLAGGVRHPKIYAYRLARYDETPWTGARRGKGLVKVGFTDRDAHVRIREQLDGVRMPVATDYELVLVAAAITNEGLAFSDKDIHRRLTQAGVHRVNGEWFEATDEEVRAAIASMKAGRTLDSLRSRVSFPTRPEQKHAIAKTAAYFAAHADPDKIGRASCRERVF